MMTVLSQAYTTDLISFLTAPKLRQYPNSLEGLAKEPDLKLTLEKNFEITKSILVVDNDGALLFRRTNAPKICFLQNAKSGPLKILGDSLRQNDHLLALSSTEAIENVLKLGAVYVGVVSRS